MESSGLLAALLLSFSCLSLGADSPAQRESQAREVIDHRQPFFFFYPFPPSLGKLPQQRMHFPSGVATGVRPRSVLIFFPLCDD